MVQTEVLVKDIAPAHQGKEMEELYKEAFPPVAGFVRNMGGTFDDAKDIFHDALVIYYEKLSHKELNVLTTEGAYILGIAKHLWLRKFNRTLPTVSLNDLEREIVIPGNYFPDIKTKRLLRFLEATGKKCMDLLRAFYFGNVPLQKIARDLGYSGEHSVSVQKYKCLEKVRETIKEKSFAYEDFIE